MCWVPQMLFFLYLKSYIIWIIAAPYCPPIVTLSLLSLEKYCGKILTAKTGFCFRRIKTHTHHRHSRAHINTSHAPQHRCWKKIVGGNTAFITFFAAFPTVHYKPLKGFGTEQKPFLACCAECQPKVLAHGSSKHQHPTTECWPKLANESTWVHQQETSSDDSQQPPTCTVHKVLFVGAVCKHINVKTKRRMFVWIIPTLHASLADV